MRNSQTNTGINIYLITIFSLLVFKITPISYIGNQWSNIFIEIVIMISILFFWTFNQKKKIFLDGITIFLMLLSFLFIFSGFRIFWGHFFDFKEFFNIILFTSLYVTIRSIVKNYNIDKKYLIRNLGKVVIINSILSIFAYYNKSFFRLFNILFQTSKSATIDSAYQRFAGTFSNPNFFGIFYSVVGIYFLFLFFKRKKSKHKYLIFFLTSLFLVNASGSRSALITTIIIGGISFIVLLYEFKFKKSKSGKYLILLLASMSLIFLVVVLLNDHNLNDLARLNESLNNRFFNINNIKANFDGRVRMAQLALAEFNENPLFGVGTSSGSVDNQYAKILMESGLIYFGLFILFVIYLLFRNVKSYFKSIELEDKNISFLLIISIVSIIFNMFGAAIFSVTQLMSLFVFFQAINEA